MDERIAESSSLEFVQLDAKAALSGGDGEGQKGSSSHRVFRRIFLRVMLVCVVVLFLAAVIAYVVIGNYFKSHFFPNVSINQMDCTYLEVADVVSMIEEQSKNYQLTVKGQEGELLGILTADDVGLAVDVTQDVEALLSQQSWLKWPLAYWNENSYEVICEEMYDMELLRENVGQWDALQPEAMEIPQNAYITEYLPEKKGYEIVPETRGSQLDPYLVFKVLEAAVQAKESEVNLEEAGCYVRASVTAQDPKLQEELTALNNIAGSRITYDWFGNEVILDGDTVHEWILEENGAFTLDEEAVAAFVKEQARKYDTYGKNREFKTTGGKTLTLPSGGYGWRTDQEEEIKELTALLKEGARVEREPVCDRSAYYKGKDGDIGPSYVEIDLGNQHLYLYIKGELKLESDLVSGNVSRGNTTPPGVFGLTYKTRNATLRGATYESHVGYWMPFNGNIGMHDATWRSSFGGDIYLTDGSHGCVNLPYSKAEEIYSYMEEKFPIICYYG